MRRKVASLLSSPLRNLAAVITFMLCLMVVCTTSYVLAGWSLQDAFYMVILTVYTVGYEEVRPINTPALHVITMMTSRSAVPA